MEQQIVNALTLAFENAQVDLENLPGGRFSGVVVWEGFADNDSVERQQRVRQALTAAMNGAAANVGVLLVYTPHELRAMQAA